MNLVDKIISDILNRQPDDVLLEMSYTRKDAIGKLESYNDIIAIHFIKVLLFPDHQDCGHWKNELRDWFFHQIRKIVVKPNTNKMKYNDYYEYLFNKTIGKESFILDTIDNLHKNKKIQFKPKVEIEKVRSKLENMYDELCDDLSINNYHGIDKYIEMLEEK